jgi:hypothetical protein
MLRYLLPAVVLALLLSGCGPKAPDTVGDPCFVGQDATSTDRYGYLLTCFGYDPEVGAGTWHHTDGGAPISDDILPGT